MKKVALIGYFNYGNFGDELFVKAHQQYLSKFFNLFIPMDMLGMPYFTKNISDVVNESDAFLIGGGDLINTKAVSELYWNLEYLKKPVFVFGIGVPNFKFSRENVRRHYENFLNHENCKLVVARDVESYEFIKNNYHIDDSKLFWFPDPVLSLSLPKRNVKTSKDKILGVVMREHRSLDYDMSELRKLIDTAKNMDYKVNHIVLANKFLYAGDYERAKKIALPDEEIIHSENLNDLIIAVSNCSLLATIKFHGMIIATRFGIPSIAMSTTSKNRNFLKMLERTEMSCAYNDKDLYKRISYFPASIHSKTVYGLVKNSKLGYEKLITTMKETLNVK